MRWQHFSAPQTISMTKLRSRATRTTFVAGAVYRTLSHRQTHFNLRCGPFFRMTYKTYQCHCFVENIVGYKFVISTILKIVVIWIFGNDLQNVAYIYIYIAMVERVVRSGGHAVERRTVNRGNGGSIPPTAVSKLRQFHSPHIACVFRKRY